MSFLLKCIILTAVTTLVLAYGVVDPSDYIHSLGATHWGFWGLTETCPNGSYAYGFEIKLDKQHGAFGDDTSINAIRIFCRTPAGNQTGEITSSTMSKGSWVEYNQCINGFLVGYDLKSQSEQGSIGDNTAANALRMYCENESSYMEASGNKWGHWLGPSQCLKGKAICGIMTLVQPNQGGMMDDTALNDVRFKCCDFPTIE